MPKKGTPIACKSVFRCEEADLKKEYTKKWTAFIDRLEQRKRPICMKP